MTVGYIIDEFLHELKIAKESDWIHKPYSWALYQTWKWCDYQESDRYAHLVLNDDGKTFKIEGQRENINKCDKDKEQMKSTIEGFTEFMRGITNNPNLVVPKELAEKYNISSKYCEKENTDETSN